jgi:hypothetical protein
MILRGAFRSNLKSIIAYCLNILLFNTNFIKALQNIDKYKKALVICQVQAGFGDMVWGLTIGKELKSICDDIQVTYVFYGDQNKISLYLKEIRFSKPKKLYSLKDLERNRHTEDFAYISVNYKNFSDYNPKFCFNIKEEDLIYVQNEYDIVVGFGIEGLSPHQLVDKIIFVNEYGYRSYSNRKNILHFYFKDYDKIYPGMIDKSEGYDRINVDVNTFAMGLSKEQKKNFRKKKMQKIVPQENYFFTYFSGMRHMHLFLEKFPFIAFISYNFMKNNSNKMQDRKMTILTETNIYDEVSAFYSKCDEIKETELDFYDKPELSFFGTPKRLFNDEQKSVMTIYENDKFCLYPGKESHVTYLLVKKHSLTIKLVQFKQLSREEYDYLLLRSERMAGCTGDMSFSEVISTNRIPVYDCLVHKIDFLYGIIDLWQHSTNTDSLAPFPFHPAQGFKKGMYYQHFDFNEKWLIQYNEFIKRLRECNNFRTWLKNNIERIFS